jgi:hypothetical protein
MITDSREELNNHAAMRRPSVGSILLTNTEFQQFEPNPQCRITRQQGYLEAISNNTVDLIADLEEIVVPDEDAACQLDRNPSANPLAIGSSASLKPTGSQSAAT